MLLFLLLFSCNCDDNNLWAKIFIDCYIMLGYTKWEYWSLTITSAFKTKVLAGGNCEHDFFFIINQYFFNLIFLTNLIVWPIFLSVLKVEQINLFLMLSIKWARCLRMGALLGCKMRVFFKYFFCLNESWKDILQWRIQCIMIHITIP